jgi:hypothetical protein
MAALRSINGETWEPVGWNGFGDGNNYRIFFDQAAAVFDNQLYLAACNWTNGGEIWRFLDEFTNKIFLPLLQR